MQAGRCWQPGPVLSLPGLGSQSEKGACGHHRAYIWRVGGREGNFTFHDISKWLSFAEVRKNNYLDSWILN